MWPNEKRSAAAGGSERGLQWTCFHKVKRGIGAASGWLHRLVRPSAVWKDEGDHGCGSGEELASAVGLGVMLAPGDRSDAGAIDGEGEGLCCE